MLTEAGQRVFDARYAQRDSKGNIIETFEQAVERVANAASLPEDNPQEWANRFAKVIGERKLVPSTPIWANVGKLDRPWMPGACFVIGVDDSLESMYQTLKDTAMIFKSGGGVGYNFSTIRPKGDIVQSTKGKASGVVELIRLYDASSNMVMQGGVRRGASMGILNVDHPEILDFIRCKQDGSITNFNLSVGITDEFMKAVENDEPWTLTFNGETYQTLQAREIWDLIAECAHACGDPGLIFLDNIAKQNPMKDRELNSTNPCWTGDTEVLTVDGWKTFEMLSIKGEAEVITVNDDGCYSFEVMRNIRMTQESAAIVALKLHGRDSYAYCTPNHTLYRPDMTKVQVRDLKRFDVLYSIGGGSEHVDDVFPAGFRNVYNGTVDKTHRYFVRVGSGAILSANCGELPLSIGESCLLASISLEKFVQDGKIDWDGLGVVTTIGVRFLDNLIDVGEYPLPIIDKNTKETRKIGLGITGLADALIKLGYGYDTDEGRKTAQNIMEFIYETATGYSSQLAEERGSFPAWGNSVYADSNTPRRNATCITIAPTGSVTTIAGCEGYGIEPIFAVAYKKATNVAGDFNVFSPLFKEAIKDLNLSQKTLDQIAKSGSCQHIPEIPKEIKNLFKGAQEIAPKDHIKMQAALQKWVDNAVSKTINAPNKATPKDIQDMYWLAYTEGLKGITVFRDGCKEGVVTVGEKTTERGEIEPRPETADGTTTCLETGCGKLYLTVNFHDNKPIETFITTGSSGGCLAYTEATSRLISLCLRGGISVEDICEQLNSTHPCPSYQMARGKGKHLAPGKSCASAIAKQLLQYTKHPGIHTIHDSDVTYEEKSENVCPVCGEPYIRAEGCWVCRGCGYSKC